MNTSHNWHDEIQVERPLSPLRLSLWLALILVAAKAVMLGLPRSPDWLPNLTIASFEDVLFAVSLGLLGEAMVGVASQRPKRSRVIRGLFLALCVASAFYTVIAVAVYQYFSRPLSYDLLRLVRNLGPVRSSILEKITFPIVMCLIGVPMSFLAFVLLQRQWQQRTAKVVLGIVALWIMAGWCLHAARPDAITSRLIANPEVELVRSTLVGLRGGQRPTFPKDFPPEYVDEFRSFEARPDVPRSAFSLPVGAARPRNAIVIILESVGTKYMSLYGSPYNTTPNLVTESAHALVFDNFYSNASYTSASFMPLNFSIYPGLPWCRAPWSGKPAPPPLASVMQAHGSRTAYFHSGDLTWAGCRWLLERQGFDSVLDYFNLDCPQLTSWGTEDRCLFDHLIQWIDEKRDQPFFAVCWTDQTHDPYPSSPGMETVNFFRDKPWAKQDPELLRYLNVLHNVDAQIGRLFAALRERGMADDTVIAITGDHGEAFADPHDHRSHSTSVYQEDVNVPLVLWNPRLFTPGQRPATIGAHVDLNPTLADVLGVEPRGEWQGRTLFDSKRPPRSYFSTDAGEYLFAVRESQWKYIFNATASEESLFDLVHDPQEQHNVAKQEAERCQRLRQRVAAWVSFEDEFVRGHTN